MIARTVLSLALFTIGAFSQSLDNRSLSGKYFFRHLQLSVDSSSTISAGRSLTGAITFDGNGAFSYTGQQVMGASAAATVSGSGTYSVQSTGLASISNPQQTGATMNARLGGGVLIGSTTDSAATIFDLFVAIPAVSGTQATPTLSGTYFVSSIDFQNASTGAVRNAFFKAASNGQGTFGNVTVTGQAANLGNQTVSQTVNGVTYNIASDGSGTVNFPLGTSATGSQLVSGTKTLYISPDGNLFIAGSATTGGQDFIIGVKSIAGTASNSSVSGLYYVAGLRYENDFNAYVGSSNSVLNGKLVSSKRVRTSAGPQDFTGLNNFIVNADGGAASELSTFGVGVNGNSFVGSGAATLASGIYELYVGVRAPAAAATSRVFLNPFGVVNAGSFAPIGNPISPGELITLFGQGLSNQTSTATALPFPPMLAGVQVLINGVAAPVYYVSDSNVSALVPFATAPGMATIVVNNNGAASNSVTVPVSKTSPGIFTVPSAGIGPGAILHADYSLVSAAKPAHIGETVLLFLTGLGSVTPPVRDGAAAPSSPFSFTDAPVFVYIGDELAQITFKGLAPTLAGLYQLNIVIPPRAPVGSSVALAVGTLDAFHDQVDIAIAP